jgi:beta-lactamase regulating signal transducer with metallopeptidase domain
MNDAAGLIIRLNVAIAGAVLLVLALRPVARRVLDARAVYLLWMFAPAAVVALITPPRILWIGATAPLPAPPGELAHVGPSIWGTLQTGDFAIAAAAVWAAGLALSVLRLMRHQAEFNAAAAKGLAGPAVVGVVRPRICRPDDFAALFTPSEQHIIMLHEEMHIRRGDPWINAALAALGCGLWFNPFVHVFARYLRLDQEAACDADVLATRPRERRTYAEALLKTHLVVRPLPLGCYWPASARHPLLRRLEQLAFTPSSWAAGRRGQAVAVGLVLVVAGATWAARPPETHVRMDSVGQAGSWRRLAKDTPAARRLDRFHAASGGSSVAPGSTVLLRATVNGAPGRGIATEVTVFGAQTNYRIQGQDTLSKPDLLLAAVAQRGDRVQIRVGWAGAQHAPQLAYTELSAGRSGVVRLADGRTVTLHLDVRPTSPAEIAEAQRTGARPVISVERVQEL